MEFIPDNEEKNLPTGVKVIGIIQFVVSAIGILGGLYTILMYSTVVESAKTLGVTVPSKGMYSILLLLTIVLVGSIIMIFLKNKIGIFAYVAAEVVNFIFGIVINGFTIYSFLGFVLPILMLVFIFKDKEVFGL